MNRKLRKAITLLLTGSSIAVLTPAARAIDHNGDISNEGTTSITSTVPQFAWDGNNANTTPTVFGEYSTYLGWAHNSKWYDVSITKPGNYKISMVATAPSPAGLNPAFSLWPVDVAKPYDFEGCRTTGNCGNANGGTHAYNQVAGATLTNANAWMLGPNAPDVDPDGNPLHNPLKWTPAPGTAAVPLGGFIGYANSGTGGWKNGLGRGAKPAMSDGKGGTIPADPPGTHAPGSPYFVFGTNQNEVLQGGYVNTAKGGGLGGTTLDPRSKAEAPLHGGSAALNLYGLAAGHYLMAVGGSCVDKSCSSGPGVGFRLEINEITGLPQAFIAANGSPAANGPLTVRAGAKVTLDGSSSISGAGSNNGLHYEWTQTPGETAVTLSPGGDSAKQTFEAPGAAAGQTLHFQLRVNDGALYSELANVAVPVTQDNNPPKVTMGAPSYLEGALISLTPTVSDPDGDGIASYEWRQTGGPTVFLNSTNGRSLSFTAPLIGNAAAPAILNFEFKVTDNYGFNPLSTTYPVSVALNRDPTRLDCSRATAGPATVWPPNRGMKPIAINGIYSPNNNPYHLTINSVSQDEKVRDPAAGDRTGPDSQIVRGKATRKKPAKVDTVLVRAERQVAGSGTRNGRVYTIGFTAQTVQAIDGVLTCKGSVTVGVPAAPGMPAVDDGLRFDATKRR